jgi:recombination-promoting nuclease RpnB
LKILHHNTLTPSFYRDMGDCLLIVAKILHPICAKICNMKKENLVRYNDEYAKKLLTNIDMGRKFLEIHLPPKVLKRCDLSSIAIEPNSYIDNELVKRFSDVVYSIKLKDNDNLVYAHFLIEHQSRAEKHLPVRILRYQLEIIQNYINKVGKDCDLPIVLAFVLYNGKQSPYKYSNKILDLFSDKELATNHQLGTFNLIDLTVISDDELLRHGKITLLEMLQKHIYARDFGAVVDVIFKAILAAYNDNVDKSSFESAISYLADARDEEDLQELFKLIATDIKEYEDTVMTYAETLLKRGEEKGIALGEQRGIALGKQEGITLGKHEAQIQIAQEMLQFGIAIEDVAKITNLKMSELKKLPNP